MKTITNPSFSIHFTDYNVFSTYIYIFLHFTPSQFAFQYISCLFIQNIMYFVTNIDSVYWRMTNLRHWFNPYDWYLHKKADAISASAFKLTLLIIPQQFFQHRFQYKYACQSLLNPIWSGSPFSQCFPSWNRYMFQLFNAIFTFFLFIIVKIGQITAQKTLSCLCQKSLQTFLFFFKWHPIICIQHVNHFL